MGRFKGIFGRSTPQDWLEKLRRDYSRICENPGNRDAAIDFFLTSEQIVDWLYPAKCDRKKLRNNEILLQICSHLANQTKHFQATAKRHASVISAKFVAPGYDHHGFQQNAFEVGALPVELDGDAAKTFGPLVDAKDLAEKLLKFWESYPFP